MDVENMAKKADPRSLTYMNNFMARQGNGDFDMALMEPATSGTDEKHEVGLFLRICRCFTKENDSLKVTEVNGANVGVAFFLDFPFHALKTDHKEGEDTIIRLVHYSDNYFSLELPCSQWVLSSVVRVSHLNFVALYSSVYSETHTAERGCS
ncbi:mannosylglycoprotein endo-beta-mannosidase [Quercus suber]|uniref:Mannosylglycoprotein endo-beta-mannosidase n=1 Tax=Quercus suber TaxID=58331 RepID=A0AAW0JPX8_QUESU